MLYERNITTRILRTDHRITVGIGGSAKTLADYMNMIPHSATLVDIEENDDGDTVLIFREDMEEEE